MKEYCDISIVCEVSVANLVEIASEPRQNIPFAESIVSYCSVERCARKRPLLMLHQPGGALRLEILPRPPAKANGDYLVLAILELGRFGKDETCKQP